MFKEIGQIASLAMQLQKNAGGISGKVNEMQSRLAEQRASAHSPDKLAEVELNGLGQMLVCRFDQSQFAQASPEQLGQAVVQAFNLAQQKVHELSMSEATAMTQGLNLGGLASLLGGK